MYLVKLNMVRHPRAEALMSEWPLHIEADTARHPRLLVKDVLSISKLRV